MLPESSSPPVGRIPARSRRQAMDWSLVLASQGIEHVLDHAAATGWGLLVAEADHEAALIAIRQYRIENRRWSWRQAIPQTEAVFDWSVVSWVGLIVLFYWLSHQRPIVEQAGMLDGAAVARGQWWRLVTATFLHADIAHLTANAGFGFVLLGLTLGRYGTGVGLLAALLAGAGGNVVSWLVHGKAFHGLGASGVVMGALGLLTFPPFREKPKSRQWTGFLLGGFAAGVMLFLLLGISPESDVVAHVGGFATGVLLALCLALRSSAVCHPVLNVLAGLLFAGLVLWAWWLALRFGNVTH